MTERTSPAELWQQACDEHPLTVEDRAAGVRTSSAQSERFRELMREHGHLIPGKPKPLPCGWPGRRTLADDVAAGLHDTPHP